MVKKSTWFDRLNVVLLGLLGLTMLYPMVNLVILSFSSITDFMASTGFFFFPKTLSLSAYRYVLNFHSIWVAYRNTIYITLVGTTINLVMSTIAAYVLAQKDMPGRSAMTTFVLITMFFSGGLIPSYIVINKLGLVDSLWALMIPSAISSWNMIIMRNFFQSINDSLKESARIDGAGEIRILLQIILPLSLPILATMALFYGVGHWNQYSGAIIYINDPKRYTLQVVIRQMYNQAISEVQTDALPPPVETVRAATVVVAVTPILCVYPFLQKHFTKGIMLGAVKG